LLFLAIYEEESFIIIEEDCIKITFELIPNIELRSNEDEIIHQKDNNKSRKTSIFIGQIIAEIKKEYNDNNDIHNNCIFPKYQDPIKLKKFKNGQNITNNI